MCQSTTRNSLSSTFNNNTCTNAFSHYYYYHHLIILGSTLVHATGARRYEHAIFNVVSLLDVYSLCIHRRWKRGEFAGSIGIATNESNASCIQKKKEHKSKALQIVSCLQRVKEKLQA
jgi:hypothetical protein